MGYQVLALKYRPKTFSEVLGQAEIVTALVKGLGEGRITNAYLFAGPRGVGKTSTARILARSLNCVRVPTGEPCGECENCREILDGRSLDLLEIDGASNRGIDEARSINENTRFLPVKSRFKIYLIDEVHMLTDPAFNALLKTLEEPPAHVKFIFATTRPDKLLPTIISRCQRYDFHLIPVNELSRHLSEIAGREGIKAEPAALIRISQAAAGSFRDGLSVLDQLASFRYGETITTSDVERLLSLVPERVYLETIEVLLSGDRKGCLETVAKVTGAGYELFQFASGLLEFSRYLLLIKFGAGELVADTVAPEVAERLSEIIGQFSQEEIIRFLESLAEEREKLKYEDLLRTRLEVSLLKLADAFGKSLNLKEGQPKSVLNLPEFISPVPQILPPSGGGVGGGDLTKGPESQSPEEKSKPEEVPVEEAWTGFLSEVGKENPFLLPVLRAGHLKSVESGPFVKTLHLEFRRQFDQDLLDRNQQPLVAIWQKKFGYPVRFAASVEKEAKVVKKEVAAPKITSEEPPEGISSVPVSLTPDEEGMVKRILNIFGGEVMSIKKEA
ncbi:MAG: DNA polymerase III subunit gamma/tau [Candidatus Omnitrophota bacterium]